MEVKLIYSGNYKTLMKEMKEDKNKWKVIHVHGLEKLMLLK